MIYNYNLEKINLNKHQDIEEVKAFLNEFNLDLDNDVDYTLVIRVDGKIKATCSKAKNVFKSFAISKELQGEGISEKLITALNDKLFQEGIYHSFVFTKPQNISIFSNLSYKLVCQVEEVALLENGIYDINKYLDNLIRKYNINNNIEKSALVMNCNPFTLGHRYLIERAAQSSEEVLIFIVEEDKSLFPFDVRYDLVKRGVEDLKNVKVIPGGEYIISSATFPSYFLRQEDKILRAYTNLDAEIFVKYFCEKINITKRFVGEEPYCNVTAKYNEVLKEVFQRCDRELVVVDRKELNDFKISASKVRDLIKHGQLMEVQQLVPDVTWEFLSTSKGKEIMENIKESNSPH